MALSFKKDKYCIIRNSISKELANLCYDYLILKRKASFMKKVNVKEILFLEDHVIMLKYLI